MVLLPPLLMMGIMLISQLLIRRLSTTGATTLPLTAMIPMAMMGLGFPLANLISTLSLKKKYKKAMAQREENYKNALLAAEKEIVDTVALQRETMEREFPNAEQTRKIGLGRGQSPRLWWRRPGDPDFLMLRVGLGDSSPSFEIELPNINQENEPLAKLPVELKEKFITVPHIPTLVDLKRVGSLVINSPDRCLPCVSPGVWLWIFVCISRQMISPFFWFPICLEPVRLGSGCVGSLTPARSMEIPADEIC